MHLLNNLNIFNTVGIMISIKIIYAFTYFISYENLQELYS